MTDFCILFIAFLCVSMFAVIMTVCFVVSYHKAREYERELQWKKKDKF